MDHAAPYSYGPDFIGIGPHKTGSTWLFRNLSRHCELRALPKKELHYFKWKDHIKAGKYPRPLISLAIPSKKEMLQRWYYQLVYLTHFYHPSFDWELWKTHIRWDWKYYFSRWSDDWYLSLFPSMDGRISGEVSPSYAYLSIETIREIYQLLPKLKVILFLRDPIDRMWSEVKMRLTNKGVNMTEENIKKELTLLLKEANKYHWATLLKKWFAVFPQDQVYIGYYEELHQDPIFCFKKVCQFLGISQQLEESYQPGGTFYFWKEKNRQLHQSNNFDDWIKAKPNPSKTDQPIPPKIERELASFFLPSVKELVELVDAPYPKQWLRKYEGYL